MTSGSSARPTARHGRGRCRSAAIRRHRCRRLVRPGLRRRAGADARRRRSACCGELGLGANVEIKAEPRPRPPRPRAAVADLYRGCGRRSLPPPLISSFLPRALGGGARSRAGECPRASWCARSRAIGARSRREPRLRDDPRRPPASAAAPSWPRSAMRAIRCSPTRSMTPRGRASCSAGESLPCFRMFPDMILGGAPGGCRARRYGRTRPRHRSREPLGEAAQSAGHLRARGAAARRGRQGHLGVERRELGRLGGSRRRRHVLRRQCRQLRRRRRADPAGLSRPHPARAARRADRLCDRRRHPAGARRP